MRFDMYSHLRRLFSFQRLIAFVAALMLLSHSFVVSANDHGGGGGGPMSLKFTTNLGGPHSERFLQVEMLLEPATPEAGATLEGYRPRIQHELILMLCDLNIDEIRTLQGKEALQEKILEIVNHIIHSTEKDGVKEVLFGSFLIQ